MIALLKISLPAFPRVNRKNRDRRLFPRILCFFLGIALPWAIIAPSAEARDQIRVLILRDISSVKVASEGLSLYDLKSGQSFFKNRKNTSLLFEREAGGRVRLRGQTLSAPGFLVESVGPPLMINGRSYRDQLRISPGPNQDLWVINVLPLEEYLVGLINFEISSQWPMEAIKAQVIAARTYAFFQRGNRAAEPFDVDSGVSDQVYGGTGKEDVRSRRAVEETRGELILHQGTPSFRFTRPAAGGKPNRANTCGTRAFLTSGAQIAPTAWTLLIFSGITPSTENAWLRPWEAACSPDHGFSGWRSRSAVPAVGC